MDKKRCFLCANMTPSLMAVGNEEIPVCKCCHLKVGHLDGGTFKDNEGADKQEIGLAQRFVNQDEDGKGKTRVTRKPRPKKDEV